MSVEINSTVTLSLRVTKEYDGQLEELAQMIPGETKTGIARGLLQKAIGDLRSKVDHDYPAKQNRDTFKKVAV